MLAALVLAFSASAAPVPPPPPPAVEVTAKRAAHPPVWVTMAGVTRLVNKDDGNYVEVTVKNVSKSTLSLTYDFPTRFFFYAKVTDAKGKEISDPNYRFRIQSLQFQQKTMELEPGDSFTEFVHLFGSTPSNAEKPGKYTARVVFQSKKLQAESAATFEVEIQ